MTPRYHRLPNLTGSFSTLEKHPPLFETPWHCHQEYELVLILNCHGKRFVGDHHADFGAAELLLIGPGLPHQWKTDLAPDELHRLNARVLVAHFSDRFLGRHFFEMPEAKPVKDLLEKAKRGLLLNPAAAMHYHGPLLELVYAEGFDRIVQLLAILNDLAKTKEFTPLASNGFVTGSQPSQSDRMRRVRDYILNHFRDDVALEDVAGVANMARPAFCRYFKRHTGKTFYHFLREVRIGHACRLLIADKLAVAQIGPACGFNNLSNFNRQFKEVTGIAPLAYKKQYTLP
ncbi:MAG TPA: AraC family transcriptional regulator [Cytophagales bacterium]